MVAERRFEGTHRLHLHVEDKAEQAMLTSEWSTLKMEAMYSRRGRTAHVAAASITSVQLLGSIFTALRLIDIATPAAC
jgi:hypothetical protein